MKIKTKMVLEYLQSLPPNVDVTAEDVGKQIQLTKKQVDGAFTTGIKASQYGFREKAQRQNSEGQWVNVSYLRLTDAGRELDLSQIQAK